MNMAVATPADWDPDSVAVRLQAEPFAFDFFQAMRVLERMFPDRIPVGQQALVKLGWPVEDRAGYVDGAG